MDVHFALSRVQKTYLNHVIMYVDNKIKYQVYKYNSGWPFQQQQHFNKLMLKYWNQKQYVTDLLKVDVRTSMIGFL